MIKTIERIIFLLKMSEGSDAKYFCEFLVYTLDQINKPHELDKIAENILKIYGGMATFGDVVIHKNRAYFDEAHDEFEELREKLYQQCKDAVKEARGAE